jgi:hypothetical protein
VVALLALAMPFMTVQVLFAPASNACGRPDVSLRTGVVGASVLAAGFLVGVQWGAIGLAVAWLVTYPIYLTIAARIALPVIGVRASQLIGAIRVPLTASLAMAAVLVVVDRLLPELTALPHLALLVAVGAIVYAGWLLMFARSTLADTWALIRAR